MSVSGRRDARRLALLTTGALVAGTLALTSASASPAAPDSADPRGTFPGANGILTFARVNDDGIHIISMRPNGSHRRVLVHSPGDSESVFSDWSPDGRQLLFDRRNAAGNIDLYIRRPGGRIVRLTDEDSYDAHGTWSPSGNGIVFESDRSGRVQLYRMRSDGTHVRRLTHIPGEAFDASYSPSGRWIAFISGAIAKTSLFVIHPDGTGLRKLTERPLNAGHPSWSPDGRRIVFNSHFEKPNGRIFVIRPNGKHLRQITRGPRGTEDFEAAYSPNGKMIAFTSFGRKDPKDTDGDIWLMRSDGSHMRNLTPRTPNGFEIGVTWRPRRDLR
jgi:Tol biopolymer transport system component